MQKDMHNSRQWQSSVLASSDSSVYFFYILSRFDCTQWRRVVTNDGRECRLTTTSLAEL